MELRFTECQASNPFFDYSSREGVKLRWAADGRHLVVALAAGTLQTWEVAPDDLHSTLTLDGGKIREFKFSPNGRWLGVSYVSNEEAAR